MDDFPYVYKQNRKSAKQVFKLLQHGKYDHAIYLL